MSAPSAEGAIASRTRVTRKGVIRIPDRYGINHLPYWGNVYHRCIECDLIPWGVMLTEDQRRRHHRGHERDRKRELERARNASLAKARKTKRQVERENRSAYSRKEEDA